MLPEVISAPPMPARTHKCTQKFSDDFPANVVTRTQSKKLLRNCHKTECSGIKRDIAQYCRTCHACQVGGKPNQTILPAPLHPIPAVDSGVVDLLFTLFFYLSSFFFRFFIFALF